MSPSALADSGPIDEKPLRFGARIGMNIGDLESSGQDDAQVRLGVNASLLFQYALAPSFAIESGFGYSQRGVGFDIAFADEDGEIALDYVEIPLVAVARFPVSQNFRVRPLLGAALGILIDAEITGAGFESDISDQASEVDIAVVAGIGFDASVGGGAALLVVDLRYLIGLTDASEDATLGNDEIFHRVVSINTGFLF